MRNPDLTTAIVVGAVVGLFFVALGHAQMVWLARRKRARDPGAPRQPSPLRTLLSWTAALLAALCFLRAATSRALPDRAGLLVGEDLFSVRPRPGLVAAHATRGADVRRGEPLLRFTGPDGGEAREALQNLRQQLGVQLASERARPLDLDAETARQVDAARAVLRDHEQRLKQLGSERDAIQREITSQKLALDGRRFRIEQEERDAARELEPLVASLETEKRAAAAWEQLLARGLVSRMEAARKRDAVRNLEGRVHQLEDKRVLLTREQRELTSLRALAEATIERQLAERATELAAEGAEVETARAELAAATEALDQDRPRALAAREKRLHELERQLEDYDALLDGRGPRLVVEAPWDGRIGFREPAPAAVPADGGPLVVAYKPGKIAAAVRLEPDEAQEAESGLDASLQLAAAIPGGLDGSGRADALLPGAVVRRAQLPDGAVELRIACDPPARVVRQLAMGASLPVVARVSRSLVSTTSFRLGLGLLALALGATLYGALRRRVVRLWVTGPAAREPSSGARGPRALRWPPHVVQVWRAARLTESAALESADAEAAPRERS